MVIKPYARSVGYDAHPQASRASAADLDGDDDQRVAIVIAPADTGRRASPDEALVDFDLALQQLTFGRDHRAAQLVQDHPRRLIARDPKLALQLHRRDPRGVRRHEVRSPKPALLLFPWVEVRAE